MTTVTVTEEQLQKCRADCKFYVRGAVFELCCAEESAYVDNMAKPQQHTIRHMRIHECGDVGRLYRRKL